MIEELYMDDPRSRYYYRRGWNPKALIAGGVAAVFSLFVAFFTPWKDWSAFSWFVGVVIAALVYYFISASDVRQPELESGPAEQEAQA
jgi:NCS1 family nucleobase:cation symporter-1